jgi:hypothetical protein
LLNYLNRNSRSTSSLYCKPNFIREPENYTRFLYRRVYFSSCTRLWSLVCMKKARLRKLLAPNQFITEESRNKVAANNSWFTVYERYSESFHQTHPIVFKIFSGQHMSIIYFYLQHKIWLVHLTFEWQWIKKKWLFKCSSTHKWT